MSSIKREMERQDDIRREAVDILVQAGVLKECENHPGTYIDQGVDPEPAYKIVSAKVRDGEIDKEDRAAYLEAVKSEAAQGADSCYSCDKAFGPD